MALGTPDRTVGEANGTPDTTVAEGDILTEAEADARYLLPTAHAGIDHSGLVGGIVQQPSISTLTNETVEDSDDVVENIIAPVVAEGLGTLNVATTNTNLTDSFAAIERDISDLTDKLNTVIEALSEAGVTV